MVNSLLLTLPFIIKDNKTQSINEWSPTCLSAYCAHVLRVLVCPSASHSLHPWTHWEPRKKNGMLPFDETLVEIGLFFFRKEWVKTKGEGGNSLHLQCALSLFQRHNAKTVGCRMKSWELNYLVLVWGETLKTFPFKSTAHQCFHCALTM